MKRNPVVHFEAPYKNRKRLSKFYEQVFGWKMNQTGPDMGHYVVAYTAETDSNNMVKTPGTINGGFFEYENKEGRQYPSLVISVDDLDKSMKQIKAAGGKILGEPVDIPNVGRYVSFSDSEGNRFSILQPARP